MTDSNAPLSAAVSLRDIKATANLGKSLASTLQPPFVLALSGPLGAGKTALCQGIIHGKGYAGRVKSPTYTLCETYSLDHGMTLYHLDLYRLNDFSDWEVLGFDDILPSGDLENPNAESIILIEWPERLGERIVMDLSVSFDILSETRLVTLCAQSRKGVACLAALFA